VSQPTLSQQIKLLEEALDAQLLDRSATHRAPHRRRRGLCAPRKDARLGELDAATARGGGSGVTSAAATLRLGMTPITEYLTTPLLDDFNARYPGIAVSAMEMSQDQVGVRGHAEGTTLTPGLPSATPNSMKRARTTSNLMCYALNP
jgi:LysR family cyn operon transcriptional activator